MWLMIGTKPNWSSNNGKVSEANDVCNGSSLCLHHKAIDVARVVKSMAVIT